MKKEEIKEYYFIPFFLKPTAIAITVIALLYNALTLVSYLITISPDTTSPIFPAAGFALAAVIILGRKAFIGIWLGSFVANTFAFWDVSKMLDKSFVVTFLTSFFVATGVTLGAGIGSYLMHKYYKGVYPLKSGSDILAFIAICAIYCGICSFLGVLSVSYWGLSTPGHFIFNWATWWEGDLIGTIILTPFLLSWLYRYHIKPISTSIIEIIILGLATILVCMLVAFDHSDDQYLFILILFWAAFRFGIRAVSILASLFALISTIYGSLGYGTFEISSSESSMIYLNSFFGISTMLSLILAGFLTDFKLKNR